MPSSPHVRQAELGDVEDMARLQAAAWHEAFRGFLPAELAPSAGLLAQRLRRRFEDRSHSRLAAEAGGQVRGFCAFGPSRDRDSASAVGEIYVLYVDPVAWRQGIGSALLGRALARLAEAGFGEVTLWSAAENCPANRFYEQHGFVRDGAEQSRPEFGGVTEVRYRLADARRAARP